MESERRVKETEGRVKKKREPSISEKHTIEPPCDCWTVEQWTGHGTCTLHSFWISSKRQFFSHSKSTSTSTSTNKPMVSCFKLINAPVWILKRIQDHWKTEKLFVRCVFSAPIISAFVCMFIVLQTKIYYNISIHWVGIVFKAPYALVLLHIFH